MLPRPAPAGRPPPSAKTPSPNRLLAALPPADYARLAPSLQIIPLPHRKFLYRSGERIQHVYFPGGGFCSLLTQLEDGTMVEVATVGNEGMVGGFAVMDGDVAPNVAMVQVPADTALMMSVETFRREMDRHGPFYDVVTRYMKALAAFIMQSTACNAVHSVEQRLSRWLLTAHDRVGADAFPLTQEFLAMMLGVSRPTVTIVAGTLQKAGLIEYRHGRMTIANRKQLEAASCECYRTVKAAFDKMLPREA